MYEIKKAINITFIAFLLNDKSGETIVTYFSKSMFKIISFIAFILFSQQTLMAAERLYVAAEGTDNVAVIDAATNEVITNIDVGAGSTPHNLVASQDGSSVWVTLKDTQQIARIDTATNTVVDTFSTSNGSANSGYSPVHLDVSADSSSLYIVNKVSDEVIKMNSYTGTIQAIYNFSAVPSLIFNPHDINISPDGTQVWVTDETTNMITVLNTSLDTVLGTIAVGDRPIQIEFSVDGTQAFTTNYNDNTVSVIDVETMALLTSFDMGGNGSMGPMGLVADPDGTTLWMTGTAGNTVHAHSLVDGQNYSYTATNELLAAHGLDISDNGDFLYTSIFFDNTSTSRDAIAVIDAATGQVVDRFYTPGADDLHGVLYVSTVPLPPAVLFFVTGLVGLVGFVRRRKA